jgi:hypothetical protein
MEASSIWLYSSIRDKFSLASIWATLFPYILAWDTFQFYKLFSITLVSSINWPYLYKFFSSFLSVCTTWKAYSSSSTFYSPKSLAKTTALSAVVASTTTRSMMCCLEAINVTNTSTHGLSQSHHFLFSYVSSC